MHIGQDAWACICAECLKGDLRKCIKQLRTVSMIDHTANTAARHAIADRASRMRTHRTVNIINSGYKQLYRGKLVGFYIGACKDPDLGKKRKRRLGRW